MTIDAIVVGAGPNGLAAALTLARAGRSVRVLEAGDRPGGGTRTAELTLPGFRHDICSAVHPLAAASPFLASVDLAAHGVELLHPEIALAHPLPGGPPAGGPGGSARRGGSGRSGGAAGSGRAEAAGEGRAAVLHRSVDETVGLFDQRDAAVWRALVGWPAERWDRWAPDALGPIMRRPDHPLALGRFGLTGLAPVAATARLFRGDEPAALLAGLAAHSFLPLWHPLTTAMGVTLGAAAHHAGWPVVAGGSERLAEALVAELEALGGEVRCGEPVRSMAPLREARAVLFDLSPAQVVRIAGGELPARSRARYARHRPGPGVFKVDYALSGPVPWAADACRRAGTVHVGGTLAEVARAEAEVWAGRHADRPFVLVAQQSLVDPTRVPRPGAHTLWAYCHVPNGSTVDMTGRIEAQIERFAPGFRDTVLARHPAGPAWFELHDENYRGGDIGGGSPAGLGLVARPGLRLHPYRTGNPRLFLCSASTPPGGGVHGQCGHHAALDALATTLR